MSLAPSPLVPDPASLVAVLFPRSRAAWYPAALALADAAARRVDVSAAGRVSHFAEFTRSPAQAAVAVSLLSLLSGSAGALVFAAGVPVGSAWGAVANIERVLRCYLGASSGDPHAACWSVSVSLFRDGSPHPPAVFPCRHILRLFPSPLDRLLPVSEAAQVDARAVDAGCAWCPLFRSADFRWLPD